jgi:hypothetical protein
MKSLHYDQCFFLFVRYTFVVSSSRNKTNPYHRNKFIPVLITTHLQAFKPKLSTYDQFFTIDQQDVSSYMHKLKHFQLHSLLCHLWCYFVCLLLIWYFYMIIWKVVEAASTNIFFSSYRMYFILVVNCSNTVILAEQSLHHNIILEKLDHCWVNGICIEIVIWGSHTMSLFDI